MAAELLNPYLIVSRGGAYCGESLVSCKIERVKGSSYEKDS